VEGRLGFVPSPKWNCITDLSHQREKRSPIFEKEEKSNK